MILNFLIRFEFDCESDLVVDGVESMQFDTDG